MMPLEIPRFSQMNKIDHHTLPGRVLVTYDKQCEANMNQLQIVLKCGVRDTVIYWDSRTEHLDALRQEKMGPDKNLG